MVACVDDDEEGVKEGGEERTPLLSSQQQQRAPRPGGVTTPCCAALLFASCAVLFLAMTNEKYRHRGALRTSSSGDVLTAHYEGNAFFSALGGAGGGHAFVAPRCAVSEHECDAASAASVVGLRNLDPFAPHAT